MKKALVIAFSNFRNDSRVRRQVNWLKENFATTVVCLEADETEGIRFIRIQQTELTPFRKALMGVTLLLRQFRMAYKLFHDYGHIVPDLKKEAFDLIIANDVDALPLAFQISNNSRVVFDAHEYAPRHFENNKVWKLFFQPFNTHLCRTYIPRVDGMLTVGQGLADEYEKHFGVKPVIITNAAPFHEIEPSPSSADKVRLIHHGIANKSRRLELMLDMMEQLNERFTLDMILITSEFASGQTKAYIDQLQARIQHKTRVRILPSVPSNLVVKTINAYDIGVFLIPPINFNYANTLPNKLFDFIQARLAIAIGPTPEMAQIVKKYSLGVVSDTFDPKELAAKLNSLTHEQIQQFKRNSEQAARDLNAEKNKIVFNKLIATLIT